MENQININILKENIQSFSNKFFNKSIDNVSLEYMCDDLDPYSIASMLIEYVEYTIGCSECMMDIITDFITTTLENKKYI